jgi:hypothetical protein
VVLKLDRTSGKGVIGLFWLSEDNSEGKDWEVAIIELNNNELRITLNSISYSYYDLIVCRVWINASSGELKWSERDEN